jgi:hypothetical protein
LLNGGRGSIIIEDFVGAARLEKGEESVKRFTICVATLVLMSQLAVADYILTSGITFGPDGQWG